MSKKATLKPKTWPEFSLSLNGQFTPVPNRRLDAMVRDTRLTIEERFDALLLRTSLGNWNDFACSLVRKSQAERKDLKSKDPRDEYLIKPMMQVDFARALKVDLRRVNDVVSLRRKQGYIEPSGRLLVPILDPPPAAAEGQENAPARTVAWRDFSTSWDSSHPELVAEVQQAQLSAKPYLDTIERIRRKKLSDFKAALKVPAPTDSEAVPDDTEISKPGPELPGEKLRDSPDKFSATPRSDFPPESHGHDTPRSTRADFNFRTSETEESIPSVGRSSPSMGSPPTDRPTGGSDSQYKEQVRDWLEQTFKLPIPIEDPELGQIADTIQTDAHFEQFQKAALRQKDPRGWKVFVTIARNAQQHQDKYSAAAVGDEAKKEDPLVKRAREAAERRKSWPTS